MAAAICDDHSDADSTIAILSSLIEKHGKGNPLSLELNHLAGLYGKAHGSFATLGLGSFKKFVTTHFHHDEDSKRVRFKTERKKKRAQTNFQEAEREGVIGRNPPDDQMATEADKVQISSRPSLLLEKQTTASSLSFLASASAHAAEGIRDETGSLVHTKPLGTRDSDTLEAMDMLTELRDEVDNVSKTMATNQQLVDLIDRLRAELSEHPKKVREIEIEAETGHPNWDEWKTLQSECHSFDNAKAQFILIAGIVPLIEAQYIGLLCKVKWHSIIDLDPNSETSGLYQAFGLNDDKQSLPDVWVPGKVFGLRSSELAPAINFLRSPWLFARGRTKDSDDNQPRKSIQRWSEQWMSAIGRFLTVVAEKINVHRPVVTLILPFDGSMNGYISKVLTRFDEELSPFRLSSAKHVVLTTGNTSSIDLQIEHRSFYSVKRFRLPASLLSFGLAVCFGCSPQNSKSLPSGISGVPVFMKNSDFLYFSEFLTLLYDGCENEEFGENPDGISDERQSEIIEEHRQAFLSGQTISFISLKCDHDATRDCLEQLISNIYKYMAQKPVPPSTVIEIVHHPGTGGSTLARRMLWDLHQQFPCVIAKSSLSVHTFDEEGEYVERVCERIQALEELCYAVPLVVIDGETSAFRRPHLSLAISDRLKSQGSKAVILHCLRGSESAKSVNEPLLYGIRLEPKLSIYERERFKVKYADSDKSGKKVAVSRFSRSFHFPLYAFVDEFSKRMKDIVAETLATLDEVETAVIRFVALIQKYAAQSVPLSLILKLFLHRKEISQGISSCVESEEHRRSAIPTYDEIYESFSDDLRVLLVQSGSKRIRDHTYGTCDLQHVIVAENVLTTLLGDSSKYHQRMEQYVNALLAEESLQNVERTHARIFEDLFMHHRELDQRASFSLLIEELKKNVQPNERIGKLLERAASVFPSPRLYSHVARYYVYSRPRNYDLAEEVVASGFRAAKPHESKLILHEMRGLIGRIRLAEQVGSNSISSIEELEALALNTIQDYNLAITSPPSRPNPLLGKVQVWITCLEWIGKCQCRGDVAQVLHYLSLEATEFFRNIVSEAFHHLEIIEEVIATHTVTDVEYTHDKVIECKMKLSYVCAKSKSKSRSQSSQQVVSECEKLSKLPEVALFSKRELRRLKVYYLLNGDGNGVKLKSLKLNEIRYLYRLLRELVYEEKDYRFVVNLFRVATHLPSTNALSLDEAIDIAQAWKAYSKSNPYVYFHLFVLYFLKVLHGGGVEYGAKYEESLKQCVELSYSFINRPNTIYYLRKSTSEFGLSALVERSAFKAAAGDEFWRVASRNTLLELEGRVQTKVRSRRRRFQKPEIYFELIHGGIRIDVGRNQMQLSGDLGRDYQVGQLVKFVVSFSLRGPAAHGFVL